MVYPSKDLVTTTVGRAAFILCLENNFIGAESEQVWIAMIDERNLTTHTCRTRKA